jgi:hypothetical protein
VRLGQRKQQQRRAHLPEAGAFTTGLGARAFPGIPEKNSEARLFTFNHIMFNTRLGNKEQVFNEESLGVFRQRQTGPL